MTEKKLLDMATAIIKDFVEKVETGRAQSDKTYGMCKKFLVVLDKTDNKPDSLKVAKEWKGSFEVDKMATAIIKDFVELERILERDDEVEIEILPNGEIRTSGQEVKRGGKKPLTMREDLGGEYETSLDLPKLPKDWKGPFEVEVQDRMGGLVYFILGSDGKIFGGVGWSKEQANFLAKILNAADAQKGGE